MEAGGQRPLLLNDPTNCINIHEILVMLSIPISTDGVVDSALASHFGVPSSFPGAAH